MTENIKEKEVEVKNGEKGARGFTKRVLKKETAVFIAVLIFLVCHP